MASAEIPNADTADPNPTPIPTAAGSPSPPLPPRKRRLSLSPSPAPSPRRSPSPSRSPGGGRQTRSRSRSRSRSPARSRSRSRSPRQPDVKRRRQNDLTVEACRDYLRDRCTRSDLECKYAHPHQSISVDGENKVTACADSLRNNCFRGRTCRYYHPPPHIQETMLRSIGLDVPHLRTVCRDFARGRCSRSANECRFLHHSAVQETPIVCQDFLRGRCDRISCRYTHVMAQPMVPPPMRDIPMQMQYPEMVYMPPPPPPPHGLHMMAPPLSPPRTFAGPKAQVCRDYLKNMCNRESCRFVHPDSQTELRDSSLYAGLCMFSFALGLDNDVSDF
ncbi:hypothetical protein QYE76_044095 [Lolium multiflorum]|uniref:C3H1-type domain-containing protein n=1 Tax=Lolium multiflorum TaxID=4521 RepID=A0AAD8TK15_LOLMU|nr:hypothetical protein QYE76_044095 [Lolium multiflorum]